MGLFDEVIRTGAQGLALQRFVLWQCYQNRDVPEGGVGLDGGQHVEGSLLRQGHAQQHGEPLVAFVLRHAGKSRDRVGGLQHLAETGKGGAHLGAVVGILVRHQQSLGRAGEHRAAYDGARGLLGQVFFKLGAGHGLGKEVALHVVAADVADVLQLLPGLHALGHHAEVQPAGQLDDEAEDALLRRFGCLALDELHVQLQDVQLHLVQHVQGGVAAAEVVHLDDEAKGAQMRHGVDDLLRILSIGALRDLQMQQGGLQPVLSYQTQQHIGHVCLIDVGAGDVDGHGDGGEPTALPVVEQAARLLPDVAVQLGDEAVLFKKGDKLTGGQEAHLRMDPAHQRLGTGQSVVQQAELGLEVDLKLPLGEGGLHGLGDDLLPQQLAAQAVIVDGEMGVVLATDAVRCQKGTVAHLLHRDAFAGHLIHAPLHNGVLRRAQHLLTGLHKVIVVCSAVLLTAQEHEAVGVEAAADLIAAL